jgi:hypothetical protein
LGSSKQSTPVAVDIITRIGKIAMEIAQVTLPPKYQDDVKGIKPLGRSDSEIVSLVTDFARLNGLHFKSSKKANLKELKTDERITYEESEQLGISFKDVESWEALVDFYSCAWFYRIWVLQEMLPAHEAIILCGSHSISWDLVKYAAIWCYWKGDEILEQFDRRKVGIYATSRLDLDWTARTGPDFYPELFRMTTAITYTWCFGRLIEQHCGRRTIDDRDRIFALVGISDLNLGGREEHAKVDVDYSKSVEQVYAEATRAIICHGSNIYRGELEVIMNARWSNHNEGWPTWVPDLRVESEHGCGFEVGQPLEYIQPYRRSRRHKYVESGDVLSLIVEGVIIGRATYVSPLCHAGDMMADDNLRKSGEIVKELISSYPTGEDLNLVYAMTLMAGKIPEAISDRGTTPEVYAENFLDWVDVRHMPVGSKKQRKARKTASEFYADLGFDDNWEGELKKRYCCRRLYVTDTNYMGLGNHHIREGDIVAALFGLGELCVLRQLSANPEDGHAFVG